MMPELFITVAIGLCYAHIILDSKTQDEEMSETSSNSVPIFTRIARKEIKVDLIYEDDQCLAFHDVHKQAPVHFLVIPKEPIAQLSACTEDHQKLLGHLVYTAAQIAKDQGISDDGYRIIVNNGKNAGQTVYHLHIHVLGGRPMDGLIP